MANNLSNYLENALVNHILRNTAYTSPGTSLYMALFTSDPGEDGSGTEVSGSGYARIQASSWSAPSNGSTANSADIDFGFASGGSWGTITHAAIFDASSGGNLLIYGPLGSSKTVADGDGCLFRTGSVSFALS